MPNNLETYTKCAGPDKARPIERIGGVVGGLLKISSLKALMVILAGGLLVWMISTSGGAALEVLCYLAPIAIVAAAETKDWYYNERLLCIRHEDCAVGTVLDEPTAATDGDRKINLLLAPFQAEDIRTLLANQLYNNGTVLNDPANFPAPFHATSPSLPNDLVGNQLKLSAYMTALEGKHDEDGDLRSPMYDQMTIALVDTMMLDPTMNFYERFYRKVMSEIPDSATWNYLPVDFALPPSGSWQNADVVNTQEFFNPVSQQTERLNPLFRFAGDHVVPYLHCEVDGHQVAIWCDDAIFTASGVVAGCFIFGPVGGAIVGGASWLLKKLFDWLTGNDGDADKPGIDWESPLGQSPSSANDAPDVVAVYGSWVMDCEHHQWFEIHPVRAYYVLSDGGSVITLGPNTVKGNTFNPATMTKALADEMCAKMREAEQQSPLGTRSTGLGEALSYGMTTRYGGGGGKDDNARDDEKDDGHDPLH